ncbi:MAG: hypothetical protein KGI54_16470 [Pseudomonadota bacterium]|nr:hypothetical protein [Pseudomonadota bacterium]
MTPSDRELAEKLYFAMDGVYAKKGMTRYQPRRFDDLYPWAQEAYCAGVSVIISELAAKAMPVDLKEAILASNEWRDGGLILPHNADRIVSAISPILAILTAKADALRAENERLREALTPSWETKDAYSGEFKMPFTISAYDEEGEFFEETQRHIIPWASIKKIMAAIKACAALAQSK